MNAALQQCNLTAHRICAAHAKRTFRHVARSQLRLPRPQIAQNSPNHPSSNFGSAGNFRACCSFKPSTRAKATLRDKYGILRRALLGGILLSAGAMPFSSQRFSSAAAADLTADKVLENPQWPDSLPFREEDFQRYDPGADKLFYDSPRFVKHIDDAAIAALTKYYDEVFPPSGTEDAAILDLCSSWISHYPESYKAGRIAGLGMNQEELQGNRVLTEWVVKDLNEEPKLPYEDNSFDIITNAVSVDYLTKPIEVFKEMHRVLKPGGQAIMSFSNRCFPTKAIAIWTSTGDQDHVWIVGSYYHYSVPGGWTEPAAKDISPSPTLGGYFGKTDPMYVVCAKKKGPQQA